MILEVVGGLTVVALGVLGYEKLKAKAAPVVTAVKTDVANAETKVEQAVTDVKADTEKVVTEVEKTV